MKQFEVEALVGHSPKEVWRLFIKNFQDTLPKVVPQHYTSCEYLDGPPLAAGGVLQINYNTKSKTPSSLCMCVCIYIYLYYKLQTDMISCTREYYVIECGCVCVSCNHSVHDGRSIL